MPYRAPYSFEAYSNRLATRGGFSSSYDQTPTEPGRDIMEGLHTTPLRKIERPAPLADDVEVVCENVEYISSYNWTDSDEPTIIVPGMYLIRLPTWKTLRVSSI